MRKITILLFLFIWIPNLNLLASDPVKAVDSLQTLLENNPSVERQVVLLREIAMIQRHSNLKIAMETVDKAKELAVTLDSDSLLYRVKFQSAFYLFLLREHEASLAEGEELIAYYKKKGNLRTVAVLKNRAAKMETEFGNYEKALAQFKEAEEILLKDGSPRALGINYLWVSDILIIQAKYLEALEYLQKSKAHFEEVSDEKFIATCITSQGLINLLIGEYETARTYLQQVLDNREKVSSALFMVRPLIYFGRLEFELGNMEKARELLEEGIQYIHLITGNIQDLPEAYFAMSAIEQHFGNYKGAIEFINKGIENAKGNNSIRDQSKGWLLLAELYKEEQRLLEVEPEIIEAYEWASTNRDYELHYLSAQLIAECNSIKGNFQKAYQYQQNAMKARDRFRNEEQRKRVAIKNLKDEIQKKEEAQRELAIQYELQLNQSTVTRTRLMAGIIVAALFILFLLFALFLRARNIRQLKDSNVVLRQAEKEIEQKNQELQRYINSNLQLENFAHLASHDLRSPLQNISNFSQLLKKSAHDKLSEQEKTFLKFIIQGSDNMKSTIAALFRFALASNSKLVLKAFSPEAIFQNLLVDLKSTLEEKGAVVELGYLPAQIIADADLLKQLVQNLILNGIKFSREGIAPHILIEGRERDNDWQFSVRDNGIGIPEKYLSKIFLLFKRLHNRDEYEGTGVGLATCKKIVELHAGQIWVESEEGKGSTFFFTMAKQLKEIDTSSVESLRETIPN